MNNLWNEREAQTHAGDLAQRIYTSRLLGRDSALVLHGGGNTSVKTIEKNIFGEEEAVLQVKGSGVDLATIDAAGFAPCRLSYLLHLLELEDLADTELLAQFRRSLVRPDAPSPSVEAMLHAVLPFKFIDHTHADALIAVMNSPHGEKRVRDLYGRRVVVVPYVMPGFRLAKECQARMTEAQGAEVIGMVLMHHGLFSWGATARESYERMLGLVEMAEATRPRRGAGRATAPKRIHPAFVQRPNVAALARRGAATPDHVIRTKPVPLVGRDVAAYCREYERYVAAHSAGRQVNPGDPAPRVALDPELGLGAFGRTAREAGVARDIYEHTIAMIEWAEELGGWQPLPERHHFDMEYWEPQQAKLRRAESRPAFAGEVAVVTGAASGIGKACVDALLARGAAVVGLDVNPAIRGLHDRADFKGIACDLTQAAAVDAALDEAVAAFGGVDMLVLNAGIFPEGCPITELSPEVWRRVMAINLDANWVLLRSCHALLRLAPARGRVVVIGSKNVPAPGPGAAAYSVSKAAVNQLVRVAALEWGKDGIRLNSIHPNMVFDTALWTPAVLESRARHYGISVEQYKTNNVLKVEVTSRDVAELAAAMCGPLFAKTTAAQIPVDGGNERVI